MSNPNDCYVLHCKVVGLSAVLFALIPCEGKGNMK